MRYSLYYSNDRTQRAYPPSRQNNDSFYLERLPETRGYMLISHTHADVKYYIAPYNKLDNGLVKLSDIGNHIAIPETFPLFNVFVIKDLPLNIYTSDSILEHIKSIDSLLYKQLENYRSTKS